MRLITYVSFLATACVALARSPAHVGKSLPKPVSKLASRTPQGLPLLNQHEKRQANSSYLNPTTASAWYGLLVPSSLADELQSMLSMALPFQMLTLILANHTRGFYRYHLLPMRPESSISGSFPRQIQTPATRSLFG